MFMRQPGKNGPTLSAIGLSCMGMLEMYGPADRQESITTVHCLGTGTGE